ncbi:MAG: hypothetical protein QOH09_1164, partial [Pseudonocardiales bacterium]|nr:hypothetical protein [Pseudonocardiales bacterium]
DVGGGAGWTVGQRGKYPGKILWSVRAVGVHLHHDVIAALQRPPKAGDVGRAETALGRAVQDVDPTVGRGECGGQLPCAVRAVVVDHQRVRVRYRLVQPVQDRRQAGPLVVGRDHHDRQAGALGVPIVPLIRHQRPPWGARAPVAALP